MVEGGREQKPVEHPDIAAARARFEEIRQNWGKAGSGMKYTEADVDKASIALMKARVEHARLSTSDKQLLRRQIKLAEQHLADSY